MVSAAWYEFYCSDETVKKYIYGSIFLKHRAFDKAYYLELVVKAIGEHKFLERKDVDELLWGKLPDWMNDKQKKIKINNLLSELRKNRKIENHGSDAKPRWALIQ